MLKSLEINGFKSFAKKSELEFGSSVSAIVGPNGSGKSNVVEAFRFVLGEQSLKSMRGKSGADLIFKGSKNIAPLNRAKVSIVFDNSSKRFALSDDNDRISPVNFDTIEISREVFRDGATKYLINGTEVRLKDIHELLASVHIGSSGHHIISQGHADRLLTATPKERRSMVEDALGLKVYQIKIKDAERKIEKTEQNMKEIESLRREIAPHIRYLKKQVDKIKEAENLRHNLAGLYRDYLAKQDHLLKTEYEVLIQDQTKLSEILAGYDRELGILGVGQSFVADSTLLERKKKIEQERSELIQTKEELSRRVGRLEALVEMASPQENAKGTEVQVVTIDTHEFDAFVRDSVVFVSEGLASSDLAESKKWLEKIQTLIFNIKTRFQHTSSNTSSFDSEKYEKLVQELQELQASMSQVLERISALDREEKSLALVLEESQIKFYNEQRSRFEIEKKRASSLGEYSVIQEKITHVREHRRMFEEEIQEGVVLVGKEILAYGDVTVVGGFDKSAIDEIRRSIERMKIKLEEAGASGGDEVLKEYEEVFSRDAFLEKELTDLESSLESLKNLIDDLKTTLDGEFKNGIGNITKAFHEFFTTMFGGGGAELVVSERKQKRKRKEDELSETSGDEELFEEEGVLIEVNLPQKKVRELTMLSGGERSLTSIALLFAMSQVNPPPFLVLDETDAALDEANSRRYGDMIQKLSEYAQLIVVTHNRETMSRAETLYGVTVGSDGASKLLSIKFGDAAQYAK